MSIKLGDTVRILEGVHGGLTGEVIGLSLAAAVVDIPGRGHAKIRLKHLGPDSEEPEKDPDTITISREELMEAVRQIFVPANFKIENENYRLHDFYNHFCKNVQKLSLYLFDF